MVFTRTMIMKSNVIQGNNIDILKTYPDNHFDAVVTDPPYGIEFLAKEWDKNTGAVESWAECFRVLKPGGYLLAFSAARTYHNLATNIEGVGFEIRDQLMWLYASGFPKAQDIGKAIDKRGVDNDHHGWKTALKPAHEPIVMARKPFKGSCIDNVLTHGVGALNIDATRVDNLTDVEKNWTPQRQNVKSTIDLGGAKPGDTQSMYNEAGRYPSNVLGEVTDYQQFFYCPKVNRAERHMGFESPPDPLANYSTGNVKDHPLWDPSIGTNLQRLKHKILEHTKTLGQEHQVTGPVGNNHPTVKPVALMKYLVKLVTPVGGKVLDPFTGSGSTGMAAVELGYDFTGCELDPDYVDIANKRITAWKNKTDLNNNPLPKEWFQ